MAVSTRRVLSAKNMNILNFNDEKILVQITGENLKKLATMIAEEVLNSLPRQEETVADENLTREQLTTRWAITLGTLNNWVNDGKINPIKIGRRVLFPMSEVLRAEANGLSKFRR